mgnify:CR=1 FL=1
MSVQLTSLDTSTLPIDVLNFYDKPFYDLVAKIVGVGAAKLLEVQGIRSVYSFLNTIDVFEVLNLSCPALKDIRLLISLEAADHTFIVQPGYRSGVEYLRQLLKQKHEEHLNEIKKKSRRRKQYAHTNDNSSKNHSQDVSQGATTVSNPQQNSTSPRTFLLWEIFSVTKN